MVPRCGQLFYLLTSLCQKVLNKSLFEVLTSVIFLPRENIKVVTTPVDSCSPVVAWAPHCPWTCRGLFPCSWAKSERRRKRRRRNPSGQRNERPKPLQSCQHQSPPGPRSDNEKLKISKLIQSLLSIWRKFINLNWFSKYQSFELIFVQANPPFY